MPDVLVEPDGAHEPHRPKTPKKAAVSAWIGSALEYYDFFIYGTAAALIFPEIFFPEGNEAAATVASLATFGVAYVARPIGSFILGHLGDKVGRKKVLLITLFGMGIATFLIGVLPTYEQIGFAAPVLLLILRICQGLAVSGEQSSASSMSLEHAPANRRAFFTSFTLAGTQFGLILATAVFIPIAALPTEDLLSWGWRIPFLLSAVVMLVAWWIRRTLHETPAFEEEQERQEVPRTPLKQLFRHYSPDVLKVVFAALVSTISTILSIYSLSYGVNTIGLSRTSLLWMLILSNVVALGAIPLWGRIGDRIGRKPVFVVGALGPAVLIWPFIWSVSQANIGLVFLFGIVLGGVAYSAYGGVGYALWSEQFDTRVRMSGVAVGTQFGFALGGFAPSIAAALAGPDLENWVPVAIFASAAAVVATIAVLTMRETHKVPLNDLGRASARETTSAAA
ncbi:MULTISPECIES: MFS transporter [unclassified Geodermatophilus]|uniref:MFS transporter n=1 Tax=unclassified Geodermatophilus TaxID=2637632 RepID=UPI003EEB2B76